MSLGALWLLPLEPEELPTAEFWRSVLGPCEQREVAAYQTARDRAVASLSRGMARIAASAAIGGTVDPVHWSFARTPTGRRLLRSTNGHEVNICTSDNDSLLVICASASAQVGVDVESRRSRVGWRSIAARFFSQTEQRLLARFSDEDGDRMFLLLWTGKEALTKALNAELAEILSLPLVNSEQELFLLSSSGLFRDGWRFRWSCVGENLVAVCSHSSEHFFNRPLADQVPVPSRRKFSALLREI